MTDDLLGFLMIGKLFLKAKCGNNVLMVIHFDPKALKKVCSRADLYEDVDEDIKQILNVLVSCWISSCTEGKFIDAVKQMGNCADPISTLLY